MSSDAATAGARDRLGRLHVLVDSLVVAESALEAGAPTLQVRLKSGSDADRYRLTAAIAERCRAAGATCLVNDRVDLALAVGADGVHVGATDLPVAVARRLLGPGAIVGGTARDPDTARRLVEDGASYLGVGPVFPTRSKTGLPDPIGLDGLRAVVEAVEVPVIAISGITAERVDAVIGAGAHGVAVIAAVAEAPDPHVATHDLMLAVSKAVEAARGGPGPGGADR
ncbi:MAG: thiamine phosphate synthase [Thermoanaerobacterales bacterium]|jgi:thiamine-phosphate pyrophosphorylase|nr:thiamine phosphate synthase [Thermoanaerobacterales bacterium]